MPDNAADWFPEWPSPEAIKSRVARCIERLKDHDACLLEHGHEQSATHRLAMYMQDEFPGWHVDVEYNRDLGAPKRINYSPDGHTLPAEHKIRPDIIVHQRDTRRNLLIVEAKRQGQPAAGDVQKLKRATEPDGELGYVYGAFIELAAPPEPCKLRWFHLGNEEAEHA